MAGLPENTHSLVHAVVRAQQAMSATVRNLKSSLAVHEPAHVSTPANMVDHLRDRVKVVVFCHWQWKAMLRVRSQPEAQPQAMGSGAVRGAVLVVL